MTTDDDLDRAPAATGTDTTPAGTDSPTPPPSSPATTTGHVGAADADLDLLADSGDDAGEEVSEADEPEASDAQPAGDEPKASPFLERPESLKKDASPEQIAAWKAEQGLPDRDAYEVPELDDGEYTDHGRAVGEQITQLGYDLDLSPEQTREVIRRGAPILKALAEAHDAEHNRIASKAILADFKGNREAAQAHVTQARAALKKAMPEGLSKVLLEARGPDGRKLAYNIDFLRWASQLSARPQAKGTRMSETESLKAELQELNAVRDRDVAEIHRPWRGTGKSGSDRMLEIQRLLDGAAASEARHAADRDAGSAEERELLRFAETDPQVFEYARTWKGTNKTGAERLYELQQQRKKVGAAA